MKTITKPFMFLVAILAVVACVDCTGPKVPENAIPLAVTEQMRGYWTDLERCSALSRSLDAVHFYVTEDLPAGVVGTRVATKSGISVYLRPFYKTSDRVLKHEMMHALLGTTSGHPAQYFRTACGDLMYDGAQ